MRKFVLAIAVMWTLLAAVSAASAAAPPDSWNLHTGQILVNFAANPAATSVKDGPWDDSKTWAKGKVPGEDDNVLVLHKVTLRKSATFRNVLVTQFGQLLLEPTANLEVRFQTILVTEGGKLSATPIEPVRQQFVVRDFPLPDGDIEQFGNGILVFGEGLITLRGASKTPHAQIASTVNAGASSLTLKTPVSNWAAGDRLLIADTRELYAKLRDPYVPARDEPIVASAAGSGVSFQAPLAFTHPAAIDSTGKLRVSPTVANLTRNLVISSENPDGVRGHVMLADCAAAIVEYTEFSNLGRTTNGDLSPSLNPAGRYSLHLHHVMGPCPCSVGGKCDCDHEGPCACDRNGLPKDQQFRLLGNSVHDGKRWGIVLHGSSYGLMQQNVVYNVQGAGIVLEDGSEVGNTLSENFVCRVPGRGIDYAIGSKTDQNSVYTWGTCGHGIVLRNALNNVVNNRVEGLESGGNGSAYNFFLRDVNKDAKALLLSTSPGTMGTVKYDVRKLGSTFNGKTYRFDGNVAFGAIPIGASFWDTGGGGKGYVISGTVPATVITNFTIAHTFSRGIRLYEAKNLNIQGAVLGSNKANKNTLTGSALFSNSARQENLNISLEVDSKGVAINVPQWCSSARFYDCVFRNNMTNITIMTPNGIQTPTPVAQRIEFDNCTFGPLQSGGTHLSYRFWQSSANMNVPIDSTLPSQFFFTRMNGDMKANYEWFRNEQNCDSVLKLSESRKRLALDPAFAELAPNGLPTAGWADANRGMKIPSMYDPAKLVSPAPPFGRMTKESKGLANFNGIFAPISSDEMASFD